MKNNTYKYKGAIHIHSIYSDGTGSIEMIASKAKKAGLDWIIISDHNALEAKEGVYDGVYVFKINEASSKNANHYLTFGLDKCVNPNQELQNLVDEVRNLGGFGFAAHPDESDRRKNNHRPIKWLDKNIIPDGIEIWNWFSEWANNLDDRSIFSLIYAYLFKHNLVFKPSDETMLWWDNLNLLSNKIVPAIGGVDAHALKIKKYIIPVTIFPYDVMFKTINDIINLSEPLSIDFDIAKKQVFAAIMNGNNLIMNMHIDNDIPVVNINNSNMCVESGGMIDLTNDTYMNIKTKHKYLVRIIFNGKEIYQTFNNMVKYKISEKGKYRVELMRGKRGFAYSNPIIVN